MRNEVKYIISDKLEMYVKINNCLDARGIEFRNVSLFFSHIKGDNWISFDEYCHIGTDAFLLIAIEDINTYNACVQLVNSLGVKPLHIFDFSNTYKAMIPDCRIEKMMSTKKGEKLDGIILGISHAQIGINVDCFRHNFVNLSCESQDIYYNLRTLIYMIEHYPGELSSIDHVVIDMFDYSYFNYDISMARHATAYYKAAGCELGPHNFNKNKHFDYDFEELKSRLGMEKKTGCDEIDIELWRELFEDYSLYESDDIFSNSRGMGFVTDDKVKAFGYGDIVFNTFDDTVRENLELFEMLLDLVYEIKPNMAVDLIMIPRSPLVEEKERQIDYVQVWKEFFYGEIEKFKTRYPFRFTDFKEQELVNLTMADYVDPVHMNIFGATKFSLALEKYIYEN